ncbi:MAG: amidohydrolase family protein [Gammaproteobacteria bacterium]|nr:amidohydrolase family protein [Gammaproteobacteria bacterium]MDX2460675.1 amidohydrolase family protein [Gammaproteobacteria bacterium]
MGATILADGVPEVMKAVRENFKAHASQIKIMAGGGISSMYDPLVNVQYTLEEMKAAVEEATRWSTYVLVHAMIDKAVEMSLDAGVKSIDHGTVILKKNIKRMAKDGVWLVPTAFLILQDVETNPNFTTPEKQKVAKSVQEGQKQTLKWAKQYGVKIGWGTDAFASRAAYDRMMNEFPARAPYFTNVEQLQQITGNNGELVAMAGEMSPYKDGPLGVIQPGAYADLLIVEGNPLEDIEVMVDYENNFKLIMKDGKVYKNTLK